MRSAPFPLLALLLAMSIILPAAPVRGQDADWLKQAEALGAELYKTYAPDAIQAQYRIPSTTELRQVIAGVQRVMFDGDLTELVALAPYVRDGITLLNYIPGAEGYAAWMESRLDYFEVAEETAPAKRPAGPVAKFPPARPPPVAGQDVRPRAMPAVITHTPYWKARVTKRKPSKRAPELMPQLKQAFSAKGVPPELAWLAEVESSLNPKARSPAGAVGLFQFMPPTARRFGLQTEPVDEREDPIKSAGAAAAYLRFLHRQFKSWPLALAAYNSGEGRVARTLKAHGKKDFDGIAEYLPTETRLYVPKVMGTIAARESINPESLPPPK